MEEFQKYFFRSLFIIIFRPEMLKFHPYSILNRETMAGFVLRTQKPPLPSHFFWPHCAVQCQFHEIYKILTKSGLVKGAAHLLARIPRRNVTTHFSQAISFFLTQVRNIFSCSLKKTCHQRKLRQSKCFLFSF